MPIDLMELCALLGVPLHVLDPEFVLVCVINRNLNSSSSLLNDEKIIVESILQRLFTECVTKTG